MSKIRVEGLCKSFGDRKILEEVNLSVETGEQIVIIGGSGCGKSVFLRLLELLETPDSGRIFIGEDEITKKGADINRIRQKMGMVYQGFHLFEHKNVIDNITLAPMHLKGLTREEAEANACELLRMVGLESRKYDMPSVLSGGQKQRIAIARCMAMQPEVLLFDEPTSALDPTMVGEVLATMRLLAKQNMTMIIVTHEMNFAREVASRVLYFDEHGIYEEGKPSDIFDHPQKPKTQAFVRKLKFFSAHIDQQAFDLMKIHGGIWEFSQKYGISEKQAYRLQLCTEEMIYELLNGCYPSKEAIAIDISIEYSEADKSVMLVCQSGGLPYNPFEADEQEDIHLGVTILRNTTKEIHYTYEDKINTICVKL